MLTFSGHRQPKQPTFAETRAGVCAILNSKYAGSSHCFSHAGSLILNKQNKVTNFTPKKLMYSANTRYICPIAQTYIIKNSVELLGS